MHQFLIFLSKKGTCFAAKFQNKKIYILSLVNLKDQGFASFYKTISWNYFKFRGRECEHSLILKKTFP